MNVVPSFDKARILVVGDVMLDRYWFGDVERISPEAPVPVMKVSRVEERPGGAANVARNVAALGAQCILLSVVGNDEAGTLLERMLASQHNVKPLLHRDSTITTTVKLRAIARQQQLLRMDFETPPSHEVLRAKLADYWDHLQEADVVVLSDYGKGGLTKQAEKLRVDLRLEALLVTRSEEGMSLYSGDAQPFRVAAQAREVYDVSGAGDTVIATLAVMLASGADLPRAVMFANRAAGIVVGKLGTAVVSRQELIQSIEEG